MPDAAPSPITPLRAIVLGLVQGPTELMPVSSSAHLGIVPRLCGWDWRSADPEQRKALEVALHGGAGVALVWSMRDELSAELTRPAPRRLAAIALTFLPAAVAGLALERYIERRLGGPRATAAGLVLGALAMLAADSHGGSRDARDFAPVDGLVLGLAQAAALAPGVSRGGATLSAARLRGYSREASAALSRLAALPVIAGAVALKGARFAAREDRFELRAAYAAGAIAALASTLVAARAGRDAERRAPWPYAAYRLALAAVALRAPGQPRGAVESRQVER